MISELSLDSNLDNCLKMMNQTLRHMYGKCSKILKTFLFLFSNKMLLSELES